MSLADLVPALGISSMLATAFASYYISSWSVCLVSRLFLTQQYRNRLHICSDQLCKVNNITELELWNEAEMCNIYRICSKVPDEPEEEEENAENDPFVEPDNTTGELMILMFIRSVFQFF